MRRIQAVLVPMRTRLLALAALLLGCGASAPPLRARTAADPEIRQLSVGTGTNAYLILGARPILVDTGWGKSTRKIEREIARHGIALKDLSLIVLTHGHGDHAGGAKRLRELSGAQVVAGAPDVPMLEAGRNRPLKPMGFLGRLFRGVSDQPFPPFTPDLPISADLDLTPYGVDGKVVLLPGHTPGSAAVLLARGDAIVGDLMRGGLIQSHAPNRHFFHDDCRAAEDHIKPLILSGIKRLFVGHGGPIDGAAALRKFASYPCPGE